MEQKKGIRPIRELPPEVRSQLRSGITITNMAQCIVELVLNALDANATSVAVRVNFNFFKIQVIDNGFGMDSKQLDLIGERYMTSKCHTISDLCNNLTHFGFRGEALASIREVSGMLTLESRPHGSNITYFKGFAHGKAQKTVVSKNDRAGHGTTITVLDFMYNVPVRRQRFKSAIDLEEIKSSIETIALIHPQASFSIRNDINGTVILHTQKCSDTVKEFSQLFGETIANTLVSVSSTLSEFKISGYIGKKASHQKNLQFVYVNKRLMLKTKFHKLANSMFGNSALLRTNNTSNDNPISKELTTSYWLAFPPPRREKHAVYIFNVECPFHAYDVCLDPKKTLIEFCDWDTALQCMESAIRTFLEAEFSSSLKSESQVNNVERHQKVSIFEEIDQLQNEISDLKSALPCKSRLKVNMRTVNQSGSTTTRKMLQASRIVKGIPAKRKKENVVISQGEHCMDNVQIDLQNEDNAMEVDDNIPEYIPETNSDFNSEPHNQTNKETKTILESISESDEEIKLDKCESENPFLSFNTQNASQQDVDADDGISLNKTKYSSHHTLDCSSELPISDSDFENTEICKFTKNAAMEENSVRQGLAFCPIVSFRNMINERNKPLTWQVHRKHVPPIVKFREEIRLSNVNVQIEEKKAIMPLKLFQQNPVMKNDRHVSFADNRKPNTNVVVETKDITVSGYVRSYPKLHKLKQLQQNVEKFSSNNNDWLVEKVRKKDKMPKIIEPLRIVDLVDRFAKKEIQTVLNIGTDKKSSKEAALNVFQGDKKNNESVNACTELFKNNVVSKCYSDFERMGDKILNVNSKNNFPLRKYCSSTDFLHTLEKEKRQNEILSAKKANMLNTDEMYDRFYKPLKPYKKGKIHYFECNESLELSLENASKCDMLMNVTEIENKEKQLFPKSALNTFNFSPKIMTKDIKKYEDISVSTPVDISNKFEEERNILQQSEFVYDVPDKSISGRESLFGGPSKTQPYLDYQRNILSLEHKTDLDSNNKKRNIVIPVFNDAFSKQKLDKQEVPHLEIDHKSKSSYETIRRKVSSSKPFENVGMDLSSQDNTFTINVSSTEESPKNVSNDIITSKKIQLCDASISTDGTVVYNSDVDSQPRSAVEGTHIHVIVLSSGSDSRVSNFNSDFRKVISESSTGLCSQNSSRVSIISDSISEIYNPRCNRVSTDSVGYNITRRNHSADGEEEASNFTISLQPDATETGNKIFNFQERICSEESNVIRGCKQGSQSSQKTVSSEFIDMIENVQLSSQSMDIIGTSQQSAENVEVSNIVVEKLNCNNIANQDLLQNNQSDNSNIQFLGDSMEIENFQIQESDDISADGNSHVLMEKEVCDVDKASVNSSNITNHAESVLNVLQNDSSRNIGEGQNASEYAEFGTEADMKNISLDEDLVNGQGCISPMNSRSYIEPHMDNNSETEIMEVVEENKIQQSEKSFEGSCENTANITNADAEDRICLEDSQNTFIDFVDSQMFTDSKAGRSALSAMPIGEDKICQTSFSEQSLINSQDEIYEVSKNERIVAECSEIFCLSDQSVDVNEHLTKPEHNDSGRKRKSDTDCQNLYVKVACIDKSCIDKFDSVHCEERNAIGTEMFTSKSISTQELNEAFDEVMNKFEMNAAVQQEIDNSRYIGIEKIDSINEEGIIDDLRVQFNIKVGDETNRNSNCLEGWDQRVDSDDKVFYVHKESGSVSYTKPKKPATQNIYSMRERFEFLPKGFSPILKDDLKKNIDEIKEILTPVTHEALKSVVSESRTDVDDLATVKWKDEEQSKREGCGDLVTDLLKESDRRLQYCEKNIKNAGVQELPKSVVRVYNILCPYSFKKDIFSNIKILGQLDKKFIVTKLGLTIGKKQDLIVLFDQHAIHERIRVESLMKDYHVEGSDTVFKSSNVDPHIRLKLNDKEARIISYYEKDFKRLGLLFHLLEDNEIEITGVPTCLVARELREVQGRGVSVLQGFLENMIREQVETIVETRGVGIQVPSIIQSVVSSEACRGSVKFGDQLSVEECQVLLNDLPKCQLPFQCAHGRPALVPVADLKHLHLFSSQVKRKPRLRKLRERLKK